MPGPIESVAPQKQPDGKAQDQGEDSGIEWEERQEVAHIVTAYLAAFRNDHNEPKGAKGA